MDLHLGKAKPEGVDIARALVLSAQQMTVGTERLATLEYELAMARLLGDPQLTLDVLVSLVDAVRFLTRFYVNEHAMPSEVPVTINGVAAHVFQLVDAMHGGGGITDRGDG